MTNHRPENAAGAYGTITLGKRSFFVSAANDEMMMTVLRYLRGFMPSPLDQLDKVMAHPVWQRLSPESQAKLAEEAARKALDGKQDTPPEVYVDLLMQAPHCRFLAWVLLQERQPSLQLSELEPLITEETAPSVFLRLQRESGMEQLGNSLSRSGSVTVQTAASSTASS